jgi:VRR-NUC domain
LTNYPRGTVPRNFAPAEKWANDPLTKDGQHIKKAHDAWLWRVRTLAIERGWEVAYWWDSRHSPPGFPDMFLVHVEQRRTMHIECKTGASALSKHQRKWRDVLLAIGCEWYCLRPEEEALLIVILEGKP